MIIKVDILGGVNGPVVFLDIGNSMHKIFNRSALSEKCGFTEGYFMVLNKKY